MIPTIEFLKEAFHKYNGIYFNNVLKEPKFNLDTKKHWGCCGAKTKHKADGTRYYEHFITISIRCDRSQHSIENTLIHEMVHLYFDQQGKWYVKHGAEFQAYARRINQQSGNEFHISTYTAATETDIINDDVARKGYGSQDTIMMCVYKSSSTPMYFAFAFSTDKVNYFKRYLSTIRSITFCAFGEVKRGDGFNGYPLCRSRCSGHYISFDQAQEFVKKMKNTVKIK